MQSFVQRLYESSLHKSDRVTVELKLSHLVSDIKRADQDFHILAHDRDVIICKHVVVAIPPRLAARNMAFEPALSSTLRSAMLAQNTWMGATAKIAFIFDKPWWKSNINSARLGRDSVIFQMMQSTVPASETKAATHVLVAFAQPPASAKVPFAVVKDASQAEADVRDWLSSATRDVLSLSSSSTPPSQIAYHTWRQDRSCFCTDGQNPAAHMSYFQHPHVGDFVLRQAVTFGNSALLFCASETDDESPGMLDGAVRSGQRAAKTLLHIIGKA
jgi:monoamine oxidase